MYALLGISTDFFMLIMMKFQPIYRHSVQSFPPHYCRYCIVRFGVSVTCHMHRSFNSSHYTPYLEDQ